jgi:hypothetical protein
MTGLHPTTELVTEAWLKGVAGVSSGQVGRILPEDNSTWAASGYLQVVGTVGGTPGMYVPARRPVVQVDAFAVNLDSSLPPWGKAFRLVELVVADTYTGDGGRFVSALLPAGYNGAHVQTVYPLTEPRRAPGDPGSYARVTVDLAVNWIENG